jgi:hypothetical protein
MRQTILLAAVLTMALSGMANAAPDAAGRARRTEQALTEVTHFGEAVAIDGDTAVVGAPAGSVGAAYVFTRSGGAWAERAKLVPPDGAVGTAFGSSVALAGDMLVVGAPATFLSDGTQGHGAVYVFAGAGSVWTLTAKLTATDGAMGDYFGTSVALAADTVAVGAWGAYLTEDHFRGPEGAAYVFTRDGDTWNQTAKLVAPDGAFVDFFGWSVALAENTLAVGAPGVDMGEQTNVGAVYTFTRDGGAWTDPVKLFPSDGFWDDQFGDSLALDGDTLAVGAYAVDIGPQANVGAVYLFTRTDNAWTESAKLVPTEQNGSAEFGRSVAIAGDMMVIGASGTDIGENSRQGAAYLYTRAGDTWTLVTTLTAADGERSDYLGYSVAIADETVVVGARQDGVGGTGVRGAAYAFTAWTETAKLSVPIRQYFAEGATGFFSTGLGLANPSRTEAAEVLVTLNPEGADEGVRVPLTLAPLTRQTIDVNAALGSHQGGVSIGVDADHAIATSRQMQWSGGQTYGSTLESGIPESAARWYFAEGATYFTNLFYLIANPNDAEANVTLTYLRGAGEPITQEVVVPAQGRRTIWANDVPGLEFAEVAAVISGDRPIVAERAMYMGPEFDSGTVSRGTSALSRAWFFAEGETSFFDTFLVIGNPSETAAQVEVTYRLPDGTPITKTYGLPATSRRTILVDQEDPQLASTMVAMTLLSNEPIVAERAMWWGPTAQSWYEGHVTLGTPATGTVWGIAEAASGGPNAEDTYVIVANTEQRSGPVRLTVLFDDGTTAEREWRLADFERSTVRIGDLFPNVDGRRFSVLVETLASEGLPHGVAATVEYARYQSTGGRFGNAGGVALATRIF